MELNEKLYNFKRFTEHQLYQLEHEDLHEQFFESLELAYSEEHKEKINERYNKLIKAQTLLNTLFESFLDEDDYIIDEDFTSEKNLNLHYAKHCETNYTLPEAEDLYKKSTSSVEKRVYSKLMDRKKGKDDIHYTFTNIEDYKNLETKCSAKVAEKLKSFNSKDVPEYILKDLDSIANTYDDVDDEVPNLIDILNRNGILIFTAGCNIKPSYSNDDSSPRIYVIHKDMHKLSDVNNDSCCYDLQTLNSDNLKTISLYPISKEDLSLKYQIKNLILDGKGM